MECFLIRNTPFLCQYIIMRIIRQYYIILKNGIIVKYFMRIKR